MLCTRLTNKKNRVLSSNAAVSGPIPEQLSALSLLTLLYSPSFCSQAAVNAGIEGGKGGLGLLCPISLELLRGDGGLWLGASALHLVPERQWCAGAWIA